MFQGLLFGKAFFAFLNFKRLYAFRLAALCDLCGFRLFDLSRLCRFRRVSFFFRISRFFFAPLFGCFYFRRLFSLAFFQLRFGFFGTLFFVGYNLIFRLIGGLFLLNRLLFARGLCVLFNARRVRKRLIGRNFFKFVFRDYLVDFFDGGVFALLVLFVIFILIHIFPLTMQTRVYRWLPRFYANKSTCSSLRRGYNSINCRKTDPNRSLRPLQPTEPTRRAKGLSDRPKRM